VRVGPQWIKDQSDAAEVNKNVKGKNKIFAAVLLISSGALWSQQPATETSGASKVSQGQVAVPADSAADEAFTIGPQDVIAVSVWKEPELSGPLPVRLDGKISMPLLNDVQAAGFTPKALAADIAQRLQKFVQDPRVTVVVTQINSLRVYLVGEVGHVGPMPMTSGMTALQAIATAGGPNPFAHTKKIYILRDENGTQRKISFNYKAALKGDPNQSLKLKAGDTIVVP
jgi:polysaccharide biosynthesis/export protein